MDPFWALGPDFLLASIFAPGPYSGYGYGAGYNAYAGSSDIYYGRHTARGDREERARTAAARTIGFWAEAHVRERPGRMNPKNRR